MSIAAVSLHETLTWFPPNKDIRMQHIVYVC